MSELVEKGKTAQSWVSLAERIGIWKKNNKGWFAELRRVKNISEIPDLPAYYRLISGLAPPGRRTEIAAFLLPHIPHRAGAKALGKQLHSAGISESRLFQMLRSEYPNDVHALRRLVQQAKLAVDWNEFGDMLQRWQYGGKRRLIQDYFLIESADNTNQVEQKDE